MLDSKRYNSSMSIFDKLKKDSGAPFENPFLYRSIIGSLQYVTLTMHDIAFLVNKLSQFLVVSIVLHWQACKRVLRNFQSTSFYGLQFFHFVSLILNPYFDADQRSDPNDRGQLVVIICFLVPIRFHGHQISNTLSLDPLQGLSVKLLHLLRQRCFRLLIYCKDSRFLHINFPLCIAIIKVLRHWPAIQNFIHSHITLNLIFTLSVIILLSMTSLLLMFPVLISWLTFLPSLQLMNSLLIYATSLMSFQDLKT